MSPAAQGIVTLPVTGSEIFTGIVTIGVYRVVRIFRSKDGTNVAFLRTLGAADSHHQVPRDPCISSDLPGTTCTVYLSSGYPCNQDSSVASDVSLCTCDEVALSGVCTVRGEGKLRRSVDHPQRPLDQGCRRYIEGLRPRTD